MMMMRRSRRRKHKSSGDEVQLNMAAMLDMAFQLLAFFILTFRASPIEAQIALRLPNDTSVTKNTNVQMGTQEATVEDLSFPLTIDLFSLPDGEIDKIVIGSRVLKSTDSPSTMGLFRAEMASLFEKPVFDSIVVRVGKELHYESLMQVVDLSTKQKTSEGTPMTKISIVPLK